jgi:hypothetical protein
MRQVLISIVLIVFSVAASADVTNPVEVENLLVGKSGGDVQLQWDAVTTDVAGNPETLGLYEIYRGTVATFVPDKAGVSNRIGTLAGETFADVGAAGSLEPSYFYLAVAVDAVGNKSASRASTITTPPVLSGFWTDTTVELDWSAAEPLEEVVAYRVYSGRSSGNYESVEDVSLAQVHSATDLATNVNWHFAVSALDSAGNETVLSNEHIDPVGGTLAVRVHDETELCWGASTCTPTDPDHVQRSNGFQMLIPADFPAGDWGRIEVTFTMDSRLYNPPAGGNVSKCGTGNPCVSPPCNGGYNTNGDPWDRTAHLFMVLDDCIEQGQACINHNNIELMRAVTPFGTDAPPPEGTGVVPPRRLTMDITPFRSLLAGQRRYIGAHIGHFVQKGWRVTTDFSFSKRPEDVSLKPPADGIQPVFFHSSGSGLTGPFPVDIPAAAQEVVGRIFITGHGGGSAPDCSNPADEFCQRVNRILVNSATAWEDVPWRDCCWPRDSSNCNGCSDWNACGFPSCTFNRSGWCPGELACHDNLDEGCDQDQILTSALTSGQTHDIEYQVVDIAGSWSRSLVVYWYDDFAQFCGDNVREGTEICDGSDLGGETCQTQGFDGGALTCQFDCKALDASECKFYECGNNICELSAGEDCLSCPSDCNGVQSGNPGNQYCCGDGEGNNPVDCSDPRCTALFKTCEP